MSVGLKRASLLGLQRETTIAEYEKPQTGSSIIPIRPGNEMSYEPELLESDEVLNDIGASKSAIGKEVLSGKYSTYLRHSGVEGQEPQIGVLYESVFGSKYIAAVDQVTIGGSSATILKFGAGVGAALRVGQALLIKDGVNGYQIRNIKKITADDVELNFKLNNAPAAGINTGKAIVYIPAAQGHPTFSMTDYLANGFGIQASAGNTVTSLDISAAANAYGEVEFGYEGTKYLFNPIEIDATNKFIDFTDDVGVQVVTIPEKIYRNPIELAETIVAALEAVSLQSFTVQYQNADGKFKITATSGAVLELDFLTGANNANTIALAIGYTKTDKSGALFYVSENPQTFEADVVPAFDTGDIIVMKDVELFIGDQDDNLCVCAQEVGFTIGKEVEDVDCMCEISGISEKIAVSRTAEATIKFTLKKYDVSLLNALLSNKTISAMFNSGAKLGGNWKPGQCSNIYMQSCTVGKYTTTGDSFIQVDLTLKGFVSSTTKDIFASFV